MEKQLAGAGPKIARWITDPHKVHGDFFADQTIRPMATQETISGLMRRKDTRTPRSKRRTAAVTG